ncbi:hypothetical protein MMC08_004999 [Hypocenomyce scalaris]|nr:hypothetical protein [Hypocenomyce scalaris]
MPNISFDVFFDQDFINITATRAQGAPKVKPAWKTRVAPKLPPKELPPASKVSPRPPKIQGPRITEIPEPKTAPKAKSAPNTDDATQPKRAPKLAPKAKDVSQPEKGSETESVPKAKTAPKLKDNPKPKGAPKSQA